MQDKVQDKGLSSGSFMDAGPLLSFPHVSMQENFSFKNLRLAFGT